MSQRRQLTRLPKSELDESRYLHPHGYVLVQERRTWSERGGVQGAGRPGPMTWWTVYQHIARRGSMIAERPAAFKAVISTKPRDNPQFNTLAEARSWCDDHPREGWVEAP